MPLVEVTTGKKTDKEISQVAYDFYKSIGKEPVIILKETPGFIGNRLQTAYLKEAIQLVKEGICTIEDVDKTSVFGLGVRWAIVGPYLNGELNGGAGGIKNYLGGPYKPGIDAAFKRILSSDITEVPMEYATVTAPAGVAEEIQHRSPETGNNPGDIAKYRDTVLLGILKLLGKV